MTHLHMFNPVKRGECTLIPAWKIFPLVILYGGNARTSNKPLYQPNNPLYYEIDARHIKHLLSYKTVTAFMFSK